MLTLYGVYRSRASRPLWLLAEIGLPYIHVPVIQAYRLPDPAAADAPLSSASPAFRAINPMGQIPAMTDADLVLTESMAITLHIARVHGGDLGPRGMTEEALASNWAFFAATSVESPALALLQAPAGDQATADAAAEKLHRPLARLDAHLAGHSWLMGDRFTVADICVAECLRYAQGHKPLMDAHPASAEWLARCQSRPAFQTMWAARLAEPA